MLLRLLLGAALAAPAPLLGPDGVTWVGPLPPVERDGRARSRGSVVTVDPETGALWVEEQDAPAVRRVWDGRRWTVDGGGIDATWPPREGFSLLLGRDGRLQASTAWRGTQRRYRYDAEGRLAGIEWGDGSRLDVRYDGAGRVVETRGPGTRVARYVWSEDGLEVDRTPGGRLSVRAVEAGGVGQRAVEVTDGAGRVARTWWDRTGGRSRVVAWEGPRGLRATVDLGEGRRTVAAGGRTWVARTDADDRVLSLTTPSGGEWTWTWDAAGRATALRDPTGRTARWERDAAGRVTEVAEGGRAHTLERDAAGRVVTLTSPSGATTRLERDLAGRVVRIVDASGNAVTLTRGTGGRLDAVIGRTEGRWALSTDLLGRVDRLVDPTNHEVLLQRDGAGRISALVSRRHGTTRLRRGADGGITRVEGPAGQVTGIVRDAHGRVRAVVRPDGTRLTLERDPSGDLRWAAVGRRGLEIERDPLGLPTRAGPVRWLRDANGWVSRVTGPAVEVDLERDLAGRLWGARSGPWMVGVQHDASGLPIAWRGSDGDLLVQRDANGAVVVELRGDEELRVSRDPRGLVQRLTLGDRLWRVVRDAAGRPLTLHGPDGLKAGLNWDPAGRPTLLRYPGGTLVKLRYEADLEHLELTDPGGEVLLRRTAALGMDGRVRWTQEDDEERTAWRYDPVGQLVAIEGGDGRAWSWAPGMVEGPGGRIQVVDPKGEVTEARLQADLPAWGVADRLVTAFRDLEGTLTGVTGDLGLAELRHDTLGRLVEISAAGQRWQLRWDPRGRLSALIDPTGARRRLRWSPDGPGRSSDLLRFGEDQPWLPGGPTAMAVRTPGGPEALVHVGADPRWVVDAFDRPLEIRRTPMGLADSGAARLAGPGGSLQVFAGGPLLAGDVALDPVGGRPTAGRVRWPWEGVGPRGPVGRAHLDPALWAPTGPWHDPIGLLVALGELHAPEGAGWAQGPEPEVALPWLPASLDGGAAPLGPARGALPLDEEPLVEALITAVLPGAPALDPDLLLRVVLSREPDLDLREELPPGVWIPGLSEWWGSDPRHSAGSRYLPISGL